MSDRPKPAPTPDDLDPTSPVMPALGGHAPPAPPSETPTIASAVPLASASLVGEIFGDFELTEELGRGGMGVVYKAVQRSLDRPVALKLLLAEHASNPQLLTRFLAE